METLDSLLAILKLSDGLSDPAKDILFNILKHGAVPAVSDDDLLREIGSFFKELRPYMSDDTAVTNIERALDYAMEPTAHRKIACFDDWDAFTMCGDNLINRATKDLWKINAKGEVYRLFDENQEPLKV